MVFFITVCVVSRFDENELSSAGAEGSELSPTDYFWQYLRPLGNHTSAAFGVPISD